MSIYQTHLDVTVVKCLVTTKINVVDTLYAATAVSMNIVDHLACVTNQPNVSTAQVITLQTQSNAHNGRQKRKFSKSNVKTTYHFLMLVKNTRNFTQVKLMQVLLNECSTFIRCSTVPYESICGPILTVMKHLSDTFN